MANETYTAEAQGKRHLALSQQDDGRNTLELAWSLSADASHHACYTVAWCAALSYTHPDPLISRAARSTALTMN